MSPGFDPEQQADRIFAAVLDATDDAIIGTNVEGKVFAWNRGAERIYGYQAGEMIGQSFRRVVADDHADGYELMRERIRAGVRIDPRETVHVTKSGQRINVLVTVSPILSREGRLLGASALVRDTTAQHRTERALQSSEARGRAIVETAADAIILIDQRGRIEAFNPAAERLFQYRTSEVMGGNISILMPEPYAAEHDQYLRRYATTGQRHIIGVGREVTARRKDGSVFPAHLSVAELTIDGETKFTGIVRDLTERVQLEMKLREESGLVKIGELAAVLAHEVKNPLAAVGGAIQVLGEKLQDPEDQEIIGEILRRLDGLTVMMGDLLLYSRPPKPRLGSVDVFELVQELVAFFKRDPSWRDVDSRVEGRSTPIFADAELLTVALQNLLINSLQAMGGRGTLIVRVTASAEEVAIDVIDTGPGVSARAATKLFEPFFTTKSRGTGLGLPTVKRIADAHHGDISVFSSSPAGTTMRFALPTRPPAAAKLD